MGNVYDGFWQKIPISREVYKTISSALRSENTLKWEKPASFNIFTASSKFAPTSSGTCESEPIVIIFPPSSLYLLITCILGFASARPRRSGEVLISIPLPLEISLVSIVSNNSLYSL